MPKPKLTDFLPSPRPEVVTMTVRMQPHIREMLRDLADEFCTSRTAVLHALITREHDALFEKDES